jgi:hypothetical protein
VPIWPRFGPDFISLANHPQGWVGGGGPRGERARWVSAFSQGVDYEGEKREEHQDEHEGAGALLHGSVSFFG